MQMTPGEIVANYKQAKDQRAQIGILADLNGCTKVEIVEILREAGLSIAGNYSRRQAKAPAAAETPEGNAEATATGRTFIEVPGKTAKQLADANKARIAAEDVLALVFGALDDYLDAPADKGAQSGGAFIGYISAVRDTFEALRGPIRR